MFSKAGRGVVTQNQRLKKSANSRAAKTFLLVRCLAWSTVWDYERPRCVSLMDPDSDDSYVRHRSNTYLYLDLEFRTVYLPKFRMDASFILHSWYPGHFAFQSVNVPSKYIRLHTDGFLKIDTDAANPAYKGSTSFKVHASMTYCK